MQKWEWAYVGSDRSIPCSPKAWTLCTSNAAAALQASSKMIMMPTSIYAGILLKYCREDEISGVAIYKHCKNDTTLAFRMAQEINHAWMVQLIELKSDRIKLTAAAGNLQASVLMPKAATLKLANAMILNALVDAETIASRNVIIQLAPQANNKTVVKIWSLAKPPVKDAISTMFKKPATLLKVKKEIIKQ